MIPENKPRQPRTELLKKIAEQLHKKMDSSFSNITPNGYYTSTDFDIETGIMDIGGRANNTTQLSIDEVLEVMKMFKDKGYFTYKAYSKKGTPSYYVNSFKPSYEDITFI